MRHRTGPPLDGTHSKRSAPRGSRPTLILKVLRPVVHQQPPPLEQVRPRIRRLHLVRHHMRQRRLDDLPRMVGPLRRPVPEARPGSRAQQFRSRAVGASSAASTPRLAARSASETPRRRPPPSARAAARISTTSPHSGTRCSRFAFIRAGAFVQTRPDTSISSHVASRTSADRAAVSTRNSNASLTAGAAESDVRTVSTAAATS